MTDVEWPAPSATARQNARGGTLRHHVRARATSPVSIQRSTSKLAARVVAVDSVILSRPAPVLGSQCAPVGVAGGRGVHAEPQQRRRSRLRRVEGRPRVVAHGRAPVAGHHPQSGAGCDTASTMHAMNARTSSATLCGSVTSSHISVARRVRRSTQCSWTAITGGHTRASDRLRPCCRSRRSTASCCWPRQPGQPMDQNWLSWLS
jgi:hypothetical protein